MTVEFAADRAAMFDAADGFAVTATYRAGGAGSGSSAAVMLGQADQALEPFGRAVVSQATLLRVLVTDAPSLAAGDTFTIGGTVYTVQGKPQRDGTRTIWSAEAVEG